MRRTVAKATVTASALAIAAAVVPALPAAAVTSNAETVQGLVAAVAAGQHSFTLHTSSGGDLTVTVPASDLLVHGINAPVSTLRPGMTVITDGVVRGTRLTADVARAFTPAKRISTMTGNVVTINASARQIVVSTAPYQTAVAFLTADATVNGGRHSWLGRLVPGSRVTFTGHADTVNSSELLASNVTSR